MSPSGPEPPARTARSDYTSACGDRDRRHRQPFVLLPFVPCTTMTTTPVSARRPTSGHWSYHTNRTTTWPSRPPGSKTCAGDVVPSVTWLILGSADASNTGM